MITQHEAVRLLNQTIFRPGWTVSARPVKGGSDEVLVGIEVLTADSSFVSRGGSYPVPLTERALFRLSARDYESGEALLFRVLGLTRDLQEHEDREFLRTWDATGERWTAPFHSHVPEGAQAWDRLQALPQPAVTRVGLSEGAGPWLYANAGCDQEDDRGDCWESGNGSRAVRAAGCEEADDAALSECTEQRHVNAAGCGQNDSDDYDCWENGKRAVLALSSPCNEQVDDDDEGPQRALALAHATAHPVRVAGCSECDGGCASWG